MQKLDRYFCSNIINESYLFECCIITTNLKIGVVCKKNLRIENKIVIYLFK